MEKKNKKSAGLRPAPHNLEEFENYLVNNEWDIEGWKKLYSLWEALSWDNE